MGSLERRGSCEVFEALVLGSRRWRRVQGAKRRATLAHIPRRGEGLVWAHCWRGENNTWEY